MNTLMWILLSTLIISLISFIGVLTLSLKKKLLKKILLILVSLSAGALMGGAFLHLIPEVLSEFSGMGIFVNVLIGFGLFFLIEKLLHWRHCHKEKCKVHSFAYMNLIGDGAHNLIDGLVIAAGFLVSFKIGLVTVVAVALHEIPQEIGDFGVLVYGGFNRMKALLLNFATGLTAIVGGIAGYYLSSYVEGLVEFLLPFAAGGFIYIAASDLIPELRKEVKLGRSLLNFGVFLVGIGLMWGLKFLG